MFCFPDSFQEQQNWPVAPYTMNKAALPPGPVKAALWGKQNADPQQSVPQMSSSTQILQAAWNIAELTHFQSWNDELLPTNIK